MECRVKDLTIHYEEVGSGRPILALHGTPLDHRHMLNDLEPIFIGRQGWRRIYPDLPGMGQTKSAGWITNQDHMLDIILSFIDTVAPSEPCVVAGTAYAGDVARGVVDDRRSQVVGVRRDVPAGESVH